MKLEDKKELLEKLVEMQESCSPITLSIGKVKKSGAVDRSVVVIKECPPTVVSKLAKYNYLIYMTENGLEIDKI